MTELILKAQAVLDAFNTKAHLELYHQSEAIAAALITVINQIIPEAPEYQPGDPPDYEGMMLWHRWSESQLIRSQLLDIVAELKNINCQHHEL